MLFNDDLVWLPKALVHGAVSSAATVYLTGASTARIDTLDGIMVPFWAVSFAGGVISSLASDAIHTIVKDEIHLKQKAEDEASLFLGALLSGLIYYGSFYLTGPDIANDIGYVKGIAIGAASEIAASFLGNML